MSSSAEILLETALRLPVEQRSRIATRLIESVDDDDSADISDEWRSEIGRRMDSIKNGIAKLVPHDEVMANLRHKLALTPPASAHGVDSESRGDPCRRWGG